MFTHIQKTITVLLLGFMIVGAAIGQPLSPLSPLYVDEIYSNADGSIRF